MATYTKQLAPTGTVGNNTHTASDEMRDADRVAIQINVENVGATPTATFTIEGSVDGVNWYTVPVVDPISDTLSTAAIVLTAIGLSLRWLWLGAGGARFFKNYRVRVTANTNVTYSIVAAWQDRAE
jgi:hypothetical protein